MLLNLTTARLKFKYSEKATKVCEIFTLLLTEKSKVKISENYVAFSEYMSFNIKIYSDFKKKV